MKMDPKGFYVYWTNQSKVMNERRVWWKSRTRPCAQKRQVQQSRRLERFLEEEEKPLIAADQHNLADELMFQIEASVRPCVCVWVMCMRSRAARAVGSLKAAAHLPVSAARRDYWLMLMWARHPAAELRSAQQKGPGRLCYSLLSLCLIEAPFSFCIGAHTKKNKTKERATPASNVLPRSCCRRLKRPVWKFPWLFPKWAFVITQSVHVHSRIPSFLHFASGWLVCETIFGVAPTCWIQRRTMILLPLVSRRQRSWMLPLSEIPELENMQNFPKWVHYLYLMH